MRHKYKFSKIASLFAMSLLFIFNTACWTRVDPGWGGIVVDLNGGDRGVQEITLETGRVWYWPPTQDVYKFPHFMQRVQWTHDEAEGSPHNQEITFNSIEGTVIWADVGYAYSILKERIPYVFVALRTDAETITDDYMRTQVRDAIADCAEDRPLDRIYGAEKSEVSDCALEHLRTVPFIADNFELEYVNFIGAFRFDPAVQTAINNKIAAENEKKATIERAQGRAQAIREVAQADKEAKFMAAEGNDRLRASLTDAILVYENLQVMKEKWNGEFPRALMSGSGSGGVLLSLALADPTPPPATP
jgi:regulator of protease activity HflC (stomatin/prohibitin superfamily)